MKTSPGVPNCGTVHLKSLGCKVNQYEGECLLNYFEQFGLKPTNNDPDLIIVNTCAVTNTAESKSRKAVRKLQRRYPKAIVLITGCLEYYSPKNLPGQWLSMEQKFLISNNYYPLTNRSRYYLKIEDGCNRSCKYCVLPLIRGGPRSKPASKILEEVEYARKKGFREIVLVGVNVGLYKNGLPHLIRKLAKTKDLPRIRISSLEPEFLTDDLLSVLKDIPFCPHLHISIQHYDKKVLRSMGRTFTEKTFRLFYRLENEFNNINIGADIIAGYPGETEVAFKKLVTFIEHSPINYLHVFPFSPRPGTRAANLNTKIEFALKKTRVNLLRALSLEKSKQYARQFIGQVLEVIVEQKNGKVLALSDNYLRMHLDRKPSENIAFAKPVKVIEKKLLAQVI